MSQTYVRPVPGSVQHQAEHVTDVDNRSEALRSDFSGTSAPTSPAPVEGQRYYHTTEDRSYRYTGSVWSPGRNTVSGRNASLVTVTTSTTLIKSLTYGSVLVGDIVLVQSRVAFAKSTTAGRTVMSFTETGSAAWLIGDIAVDAGDIFYQEASLTYLKAYMFMARVTTAGTLTVQFDAQSYGSNADVAADTGELVITVLSLL